MQKGAEVGEAVGAAASRSAPSQGATPRGIRVFHCLCPVSGVGATGGPKGSMRGEAATRRLDEWRLATASGDGCWEFFGTAL